MTSNDEQFGAILKRLEMKMDAMNVKLDNSIINMNERFAAVDERFVKSEAIMESAKEQIGLVENNLNTKIISVKDEVSADIKTQIGTQKFLKLVRVEGGEDEPHPLLQYSFPKCPDISVSRVRC